MDPRLKRRSAGWRSRHDSAPCTPLRSLRHESHFVLDRRPPPRPPPPGSRRCCAAMRRPAGRRTRHRRPSPSSSPLSFAAPPLLAARGGGCRGPFSDPPSYPSSPGSFCSAPHAAQEGRSTTQLLFRRLAAAPRPAHRAHPHRPLLEGRLPFQELLGRLPLLRHHSHFLFVPGPADASLGPQSLLHRRDAAEMPPRGRCDSLAPEPCWASHRSPSRHLPPPNPLGLPSGSAQATSRQRLHRGAARHARALPPPPQPGALPAGRAGPPPPPPRAVLSLSHFPISSPPFVQTAIVYREDVLTRTKLAALAPPNIAECDDVRPPRARSLGASLRRVSDTSPTRPRRRPAGEPPPGRDDAASGPPLPGPAAASRLARARGRKRTREDAGVGPARADRLVRALGAAARRGAPDPPLAPREGSTDPRVCESINRRPTCSSWRGARRSSTCRRTPRRAARARAPSPSPPAPLARRQVGWSLLSATDTCNDAPVKRPIGSSGKWMVYRAAERVAEASFLELPD